ncbi:MAG: 5-aminolevulic acid synthase, partial [Pseudomonadota bacterium]
RDCEALRKRSDQPCVIAARVLPKRFKNQPLTLSNAATGAFKSYRDARGPKAFAISPATQAFGLAQGATAIQEALGACNAKVGQGNRQDCVIVIQDAK